MKRKPRIAILHYAAPPTIGGVETTIAAHARLLADHGYAVQIIAGRGKALDSRVPIKIVRDVDSKSPRVLGVNAQLARGRVSEQFHSLVTNLTRQLTRSLAQCDVLIAHNVLSLHKNLALTTALKNLADVRKIKIIAWCHDFAWSDPLYAPDVHPGMPWALIKHPWAGVTYVVVSESRKQELEDLWGERGTITVVPPGINPEEFLGVTQTTARWVRELALLDAAPLLLLPARITRRKNIERAMEIVAALAAQGKNPKLIVTGPPGPHNPSNASYLDGLRFLQKSLGVDKSVIFLHEFGHVSTTILRDLYLLADGLLFPSEREGFGIPLLEAGLARLPIFCADLSPFHETTREHAHYFSPAESTYAIAARIIAFLDNDSVYQMKKRVVQEYRWERIFAQKIEELL